MGINSSLFKASVGAVLAMALGSAAHAVQTGTTCQTINAINGVKFSLQECSSSSQPDSTYYNISNNSGSALNFLAVSTTETGKVPWVERPNWRGSYVTEAEWDSPDNVWLNFMGSFDSLFGSHDTGAFIYQVSTESQSDLIASGSTSIAEFGFMGRPSTNFVALAGESIVAQSFSPTAAVPEPGTYALMGLGLLGLGAAVRRQRQAA